MLHTRFVFTAILFFITGQVFGQRLSPTEEKLLGEALVSFQAQDDMALTATVADLIKNKSVVAAGEATHGTREVDQLQLRIAKTLVQDYDFNAVALGEIYISSTWILNDYVVSGKHSAQKAIQAAFKDQFGGASAEMLNFIDWLRALNATRPLEQRVWLMGTEIGPPGQLARIALDYSRKHSISLPDSLQKTLLELLAIPVMYEARRDINQLLTRTRALSAFLVNERNADSLTVHQQWQLRCIRQLPEAVETFSRPTQAYRDRGIYENIRWLKERRPDTKIVIIDIHNGHIEKRPCFDWEPVIRAGFWLDSAYQQGYLAIATEVGRGTYESGGSKGTKVIRVPESGQKLGTLLRTISPAPYGLIRLNTSPEITQFFRKHNRLTYGTSDQKTGMVGPCAALPDAFDALLYSRESTPSQISVVAHGKAIEPRFTLYLNMTDSLKQLLLRNGQFRISLQTDFSQKTDYEPFVRLAVYFHDKRKKQLGYRVLPINDGLPVEQLFDVPPKTHFISISLNADQTDTLALRRFAINGKLIPASTFSFHDWSPTSQPEHESYQAVYKSEQILIQTK